jgi:hypothetical protein
MCLERLLLRDHAARSNSPCWDTNMMAVAMILAGGLLLFVGFIAFAFERNALRSEAKI